MPTPLTPSLMKPLSPRRVACVGWFLWPLVVTASQQEGVDSSDEEFFEFKWLDQGCAPASDGQPDHDCQIARNLFNRTTAQDASLMDLEALSSASNFSSALTNYSLKDEADYRHTWYLAAAYASAYIVVFIVGTIGNVLVILVVGLNRQMRSIPNLFLLNLAVADLLVLIFCLPGTLLSNLFV
ncbi:unnamed protein product, partial [Cyprideis torosa]